MTDETTVWTKGDDTAALVRLLERAAEAGVRVTATFEFEDATETLEATPSRSGAYYWLIRNRRIVVATRPHHALTSVTSPLPPEPVRPDWLPKGAEDGDWLVSGDGKSLARWDGSTLIWIGRPVVEPRVEWRVWPVWAQVKAERERSSRSDSVHDAYREGLEARNEALLTEVERLSTVTDEMVDAGISAVTPTGDVRDALTAALAKRDEGKA